MNTVALGCNDVKFDRGRLVATLIGLLLPTAEFVSTATDVSFDRVPPMFEEAVIGL